MNKLINSVSFSSAASAGRVRMKSPSLSGEGLGIAGRCRMAYPGHDDYFA